MSQAIAALVRERPSTNQHDNTESEYECFADQLLNNDSRAGIEVIGCLHAGQLDPHRYTRGKRWIFERHRFGNTDPWEELGKYS